MGHTFNPENKDKLDTKQRRRDLPPQKILEKFSLQDSDTIADVGCGIGYFTIPLAQMVNSRVYAFDIAQEMLDEIAAKKREYNLDNIKLINTKQESNYLPEEEIDFMLMSNLIHEVDNKSEFLEHYLQPVKAGGRLAVIDFKKKSAAQGPPVTERISKAELYKLLEQDLGLKLKLVSDLNEQQYVVIAEK